MDSSLRLLGFTSLAALAATLLAAAPAIGLAWLLARRDFRGRMLVESLVLLPLVLPPVATGLVLLQLFGRLGPLGGPLRAALGIDVAFSRVGVVLAMAIMAFPIFVLTARAAFESVEPRLEHVASTLGASGPRVFVTVTLPLAWPGLVAALVLAFARAVGEFGATITIAGAIPGRTMTLATAIWQRLQAGDDDAALRFMGVSVALALGATAAAGLLARRGRRRA